MTNKSGQKRPAHVQRRALAHRDAYPHVWVVWAPLGRHGEAVSSIVVKVRANLLGLGGNPGVCLGHRGVVAVKLRPFGVIRLPSLRCGECQLKAALKVAGIWNCRGREVRRLSASAQRRRLVSSHHLAAHSLPMPVMQGPCLKAAPADRRTTQLSSIATAGAYTARRPIMG